jgi:hypothetical protein
LRELAATAVVALDRPRIEADMPITLFDRIIYGDTSGGLGRGAHAGDQSIDLPSEQTSLTLIGDARSLAFDAVGGNDTLLDSTLDSTSIFGDALDLSGRARGGDDAIQAFARKDGDEVGD